MKNFFYFLLSAMLCLLLIGGIYVATQDNTNTKPPDDSQLNSSVVEDGSSNSGSTDGENSSTDGTSSETESGTENSGNIDGDNAGENTGDGGLKEPSNVSMYLANGLTMQSGAQLSMEERALRFTCDITTELYNEVQADTSKSLGMLVMPRKFFDQVNTENYTYIDWIKAFDAAGLNSYIYHVYEESGIGTTGSGYYMRIKLYDIGFGAINQEIVALGVLATTATNGNVTYKYSALPIGVTYRDNARSMAYVAAATLNAQALGMANHSADDVAVLKGYINDSVDKANGKTEATDDGSMYAFTTNITAPQKLSIGESFTVVTTISPNVNVPVWYRSSDESIIEVDESGKVTAKGKGTAVVGVYVAGESYGITVTVS